MHQKAPLAPLRMLTALCGSLTLAGTVFLAGCDDDFNHHPPAGMGSLIVDNATDNKIYVYLNGYETNSVQYYDYEYYDLNPGVYRVVLEEKNGPRSYRDDVDLLKDQRTVLEVKTDAASSSYYDVRVYFD